MNWGTTGGAEAKNAWILTFKQVAFPEHNKVRWELGTKLANGVVPSGAWGQKLVKNKRGQAGGLS